MKQYLTKITCNNRTIFHTSTITRGHLVKVIWSFSISETRLFAHYI